jgi:T5SS/PEP-CTERM-associated repeat protein
LFIAAEGNATGTVNINGGEVSLTDIVHVGYGGSGNLTLAGNGVVQAMSTLTIGSGISQVSVAANRFGAFAAVAESTLTLAPGSALWK